MPEQKGPNIGIAVLIGRGPGVTRPDKRAFPSYTPYS